MVTEDLLHARYTARENSRGDPRFSADDGGPKCESLGTVEQAVWLTLERSAPFFQLHGRLVPKEDFRPALDDFT